MTGCTLAMMKWGMPLLAMGSVAVFALVITVSAARQRRKLERDDLWFLVGPGFGAVAAIAFFVHEADSDCAVLARVAAAQCASSLSVSRVEVGLVSGADTYEVSGCGQTRRYVCDHDTVGSGDDAEGTFGCEPAR
jgi:hypothetical protein